jgi:predicted ATPase
MSIDAIGLKNFRGFRDVTLPLKPLTVLLGPNSSGKSSFGHGLAAMAHAHRLYRGTPQATLTPSQDEAKDWPVDLGGFDDLRTTGSEGPVQIELSSDAGIIKMGFGVKPIRGLVPSYFSIPPQTQTPKSQVTGSETVGTGVARNKKPIEEATTHFGFTPESETFVERPEVELRRINENQWLEGADPSVVVLDGLLPKAFFHHGGTSWPINLIALKELEFLFSTLTYLRANRRRPFRVYPKEFGKYQKIGYGGEWTATVLRTRKKVQYAMLPKLPKLTQQQKKTDSKYLIKEESLAIAVRRWLNHLGIAQSVKSAPVENDSLEVLITLTGQEPHNVTEVGFGVGQVLPVLTAGLLQPKGSIFIVDLPEAHLHPRPQAEIADFFCSLALMGRYCLVETHSEMFFHRLRLRAEMIPTLREKVAVYFLDAATENLCCKPREIGLELDREPDWPLGFFQEGWEMEVALGTLRRAKNVQTK